MSVCICKAGGCYRPQQQQQQRGVTGATYEGEVEGGAKRRQVEARIQYCLAQMSKVSQPGRQRML